MLIAVTGLPGTGKSTIARAVAAELRAGYFSVDFVFGFLEQEGLTSDDPLGKRSYALIREFARLHLDLGLSAVIDAVNPFESIRADYRNLAAERGVAAVLIATTCADGTLHRSRIEDRFKRDGLGIGWEEVERQAGYYEPPTKVDLSLDAGTDLNENVERACNLVRDGCRTR